MSTSPQARTVGKVAAWLIPLIGVVEFFVVYTSRFLPSQVASHFGADGVADGYLAQPYYLGLMLALLVLLPSALAFLPAAALNRPGARLRLPNADYWLTPERRDASVAWLVRHLARHAALMAVFIGYLHWVLVGANLSLPAHLPQAWFAGGLLGYLLLSLWWASALMRRFRRLPAARE